MYYVLFDVETTGRDTRDEVVQFAAIIAVLVDGKLTIKRLINRFFISNQPIHPDAFQAHQLTKEYLIEHSNHKFFEDLVLTDPIFRKEPNATFISYNIAFDTRLCNQTLLNNGHVSLDFGERLGVLRKRTKEGRYSFDMMTALAKLFNHGHNMKQVEALRRVLYHENKGCTVESIERAYKVLVAQTGIHSRGHLHDALYDCFILFSLLSKTQGMVMHG